MKKCKSCGKEKEDDEMYCGRCEKIVGDVMMDLRVEMECDWYDLAGDGRIYL